MKTQLAIVFGMLSYTSAAAAAPMSTEAGTPIAWKKGITLETVSDDINIGDRELAAALDDALRMWTGGVQSAPKVAVAPSTDRNVQNNREVHRAMVISDSWPGDDEALAVTTYTFRKSTGEIVDADIIINGTEPCLSLAATMGDGCYDLRSVLVHETGHFLGLDHDDEQDSVMFPTLSAGDVSKRAPTDEDFSSLAVSYGGRAQVGTAARETVQMLVPVARRGCSQTDGGASALSALAAFFLLFSRRRSR